MFSPPRHVSAGFLQCGGDISGASKLLALASLSLFCLAPAVGAESLNDIAELFGRADAIGNPHISPDGKHLAVECSREVKPSICIFPLDSAGSPILLPVIQDVRLVGHSCAKSDTLILDIEVFETLHVNSRKEDYTFPRAIAFNLIDQKPVMLMKGNRSWVDTNNLAAIAPDDPDKIIFSIVAGPGDKAPNLGGRSLGEMETISYQARDGLTIPAYLTLAPGKARGDGPFPPILLPHGGPEARDTLSFEACAAAGYAVIQPNVRGETGCGTDFRDAGYGEFGGKMVTDILGAATWSDAEGLSVPGKPFIVGVSYGGYAALMAPLQDDAAIQCVVAVNPVTSPFKYLSD